MIKILFITNFLAESEKLTTKEPVHKIVNFIKSKIVL
jgi:hypothetical protein